MPPEQQSPRAARIPFHACEYFEETGENCVICNLPPLSKQQSSLDADERFRRDMYLLLQEAGGYNHPDKKVREAFDLATLGIAEEATQSPRVCPHLHQDFPGTAINKCLDCGVPLGMSFESSRVCVECGHNNLAFGVCQEQVDVGNLTPIQMVELHQEFWDAGILRCGCKCIFPD